VERHTDSIRMGVDARLQLQKMAQHYCTITSSDTSGVIGPDTVALNCIGGAHQKMSRWLAHNDFCGAPKYVVDGANDL